MLLEDKHLYLIILCIKPRPTEYQDITATPYDFKSLNVCERINKQTVFLNIQTYLNVHSLSISCIVYIDTIDAVSIQLQIRKTCFNWHC